MKLNIPHLSYQKIGEIADQFLTKYYPQLKLPIPIEEIAESKLNLKIYEQINLRKDFDIDSFLTSDLSTIFIDLDIYAKVENRTRCSIAHEIGHLIIHGGILKKQKIKSLSDLVNFLNVIDDDDYRWLEYQAYSFAGHVLVPKRLLLKELKNRFGKIPHLEIPEIITPVAQDLLNIFQVSADVMFRRLQKEEIVKSNS